MCYLGWLYLQINIEVVMYTDTASTLLQPYAKLQETNFMKIDTYR